MIRREHVLENLLNLGNNRTQWMVYEIMDSYPNVNLKDLAKHLFVPLRELRDTARLLESWGWLKPYGRDKYYVVLDYGLVEEIKEALRRRVMKPWKPEDYEDFYHDLTREERRLLNRIIYSSGKVSIRTLMGMMKGEGFFKVASLERKLRNFCYDRGLALPLKRSKKFINLGVGRTQAEYVVDRSFQDSMRSVVRR